MPYQNVRVEVAAPVATLVLSRPQCLNALNLDTARELRTAVEEVRTQSDVRAVILRGEGRAFCAGADIREILGWIERKQLEGLFDELLREAHASVSALWELPQPVIAAVHGVAAGAGMSLALACDLRLAAQGTRLNLAFINVGLVPDSGCSYTLPLLVGLGKALELALAGNAVDASEAERLGIVNHVYPEGELVAQAEALARGIAEKSSVAVRKIKRILHETHTSRLEEQLDAERRAQMEIVRSSRDFIEGVHAFLEKRPACFNRS